MSQPDPFLPPGDDASRQQRPGRHRAPGPADGPSRRGTGPSWLAPSRPGQTPWVSSSGLASGDGSPYGPYGQPSADQPSGPDQPPSHGEPLVPRPRGYGESPVGQPRGYGESPVGQPRGYGESPVGQPRGYGELPVGQPRGYGELPVGQPPPRGYGWPADQPPLGYVPRPAPAKSSVLAMVSLIMGLLWLGGLGSVVGIVTGIVALALIASGKASGRGMALGGITAGVVTLAFSGLLLAGLLPVVTQPHDVHAQSRAEGPPPLPVPVDPDSPYPVYGSEDMVQYMAQRMITHDATVDLRPYQLEDPKAAEDALLEAVTQNPYVVDVRTYGCGTDLCRIGYGYTADEQAAIQQQLLEVSTAILAETVDESMSDVEKVQAINGWLTKNARYDTAAADLLPDEPTGGFDVPDEYRYAWNASGVLLDGRGVCESYAEAFDLLANAAGVPTVIVSGYLLSDHAPHAWNKVYVGGVWKAVDVTWNDGPPTTTDYLLIDDSDFTGEAAREEDDQWMTDALIPTYATP